MSEMANKLYDPNDPVLSKELLSMKVCDVSKDILVDDILQAIKLSCRKYGFLFHIEYELDCLVVKASSEVITPIPFDALEYVSRKTAELLDEYAERKNIGHGIYAVKSIFFCSRYFPEPGSNMSPIMATSRHFVETDTTYTTKCTRYKAVIREAVIHEKDAGFDFSSARSAAIDAMSGWSRNERPIPDTRKNDASGIYNSGVSSSAFQPVKYLGVSGMPPIDLEKFNDELMGF